MVCRFLIDLMVLRVIVKILAVFLGVRRWQDTLGVGVTIQNLRVALVDSERNLILVRGAIPGPKGGFVL